VSIVLLTCTLLTILWTSEFRNIILFLSCESWRKIILPNALYHLSY
jgi:hypothetical protein